MIGKALIGIGLIFISCSGLKVGAYAHYYKGGHSNKLIITSDSTLTFTSNVSMLSAEIRGYYTVNGKIITFIPVYNEMEKSPDTLPFNTRNIYLKNRRILILDGLRFKYTGK